MIRTLGTKTVRFLITRKVKPFTVHGFAYSDIIQVQFYILSTKPIINM